MASADPSLDDLRWRLRLGNWSLPVLVTCLVVVLSVTLYQVSQGKPWSPVMPLTTLVFTLVSFTMRGQLKARIALAEANEARLLNDRVRV